MMRRRETSQIIYTDFVVIVHRHGYTEPRNKLQIAVRTCGTEDLDDFIFGNEPPRVSEK